MKATITFLLCIGFSVSNAQPYYKYEYQFPDTIPKEYRFSVDTTYIQTIETLRKSKDINISNSEKLFDEFAKGFVGYKTQLFYEGNVYLNWKEAEAYVNQVFRTIAPDEIRNDSSYKVFIVRDADFNAFSAYDRHFYVNVGLLAYVEDEAMLASVLAHELGHYVYYHNFNRFVRERRAEKAIKSLYNVYGIAGLVTSLSAITEARDQEREADHYSLQLMQKAGYSMESCRKCFLLEDRCEKFYKMHLSPFFSWGSSLHPESLERASAVEKWINPAQPGKTFMVSKDLFTSIRAKARYQLLEVMMDLGFYHPCITQAFEFYLQDPKEASNLYFILEAIRRWNFFQPKLLSKKFITFSPTYGSAVNLLENLYSGYLFSSPQELQRSPAKELIDPVFIEFRTYKEAFDYFVKQLEKTPCTECLLSAALLHHEDPLLANPFITSYLADSAARYRSYATALATGDLTIQNGKKAVVADVVIDRMQLVSYKNATRKFDKTYDFSDFLSHYIDSCYTSQSKVGIYYNYDQVEENFRMIHLFQSVNYLPNIYINNNALNVYNRTTGEVKNAKVLQQIARIRLDLFNPAIWDFCYRHHLSEFYTVDWNVNPLQPTEEMSHFWTEKGITTTLDLYVKRYKIGSKLTLFEPPYYKTYHQNYLNTRINYKTVPRWINKDL